MTCTGSVRSFNDLEISREGLKVKVSDLGSRTLSNALGNELGSLDHH